MSGPNHLGFWSKWRSDAEPAESEQEGFARLSAENELAVMVSGPAGAAAPGLLLAKMAALGRVMLGLEGTCATVTIRAKPEVGGCCCLSSTASSCFCHVIYSLQLHTHTQTHTEDDQLEDDALFFLARGVLRSQPLPGRWR